jgi:hypothetical protein
MQSKQSGIDWLIQHTTGFPPKILLGLKEGDIRNLLLYSLRPSLFDALAHFTKTNAPPVGTCNSSMRCCSLFFYLAAEGINCLCARFSSIGDFFFLCLFIYAGAEPRQPTLKTENIN